MSRYKNQLYSSKDKNNYTPLSKISRFLYQFLDFEIGTAIL